MDIANHPCYTFAMSRLARIVASGQPRHITQHGNNRRDVFFVDGDRQIYLKLLRAYGQFEFGFEPAIAFHA